MRWRRKKPEPDARDVGRIEIISYVQCALVAAMALAAVTMARGYGARDVAPAPVITPTRRRDRLGASRRRLDVSRVTRQSAARRADAEPPTSERHGDRHGGRRRLSSRARSRCRSTASIPPTLHSNFDERRGGGTREHQALDIMAPRGTPIHSAASGRVLKLFTSMDGGLMVYAADSSERFVLMYAHLDRYAPALTDSTRLARGQVIGFVGSTGNASPNAPHLHFAIARSADVKHWSRGKPIDPLPMLVGAKGEQR